MNKDFLSSPAGQSWEIASKTGNTEDFRMLIADMAEYDRQNARKKNRNNDFEAE